MNDFSVSAVIYVKESPGVFIAIDTVACTFDVPTNYYLYKSYDVNGDNDYTHERVGCVVVKSYELYFETPHIVSDTAFIGLRYYSPIMMPPPLIMSTTVSLTNPYVCPYLAQNSGWSFTQNMSDRIRIASSVDVDTGSTYRILNNYIWGGTFPIVGFHCKTPPRILGAVPGNGSCTLAWESSGDGTYEVAVAPWGASPDTVSRRYVTTDTVIHIDSLDYGTTYSVWVRGRCSFPTTTMWSNWSSRMPVYVQTGVQEADGPRFEITPNPASGTVTVEHGFADGTISVLDMQGRTVLTAPAGQHTLDISHLAAGSYVVRLETPSGIGTRLLQVQ